MDDGCIVNQLQPGKRMLRGHQPARAVLLDISHTLELKVWHRVMAALHSLLSIVCNMTGVPRVPLITIYLLDSFPEVMLPFSPPKGNLCRIVSALRDIRTFIEDRLQSGAPRPTPCLSLGVTEACGQYRRHLNAIGQLQRSGNVQLDQLEVVLLTGGSQSGIRALLDGLDNQVDMTHLKRLVAVLLTNNGLDDVESPHSSISNPKDSEDGSIVDFVHLDTDEGSLQRFFYTWLLDSSSESEHLHLVLPPASPADKELLIKCDTVERIVNPAQLPHHEAFNLHPDSTHCKMVFPCPSKAAGLTVPVHTLKVTATLPAEAVCDSLVFGLPLLVQATTCWRIDWEELEENAANFHALCQELTKNKSQVLLAQLQNQPATTTTAAPTASTKNQNRQTASSAIRGLFILVPSVSNTLLLKAVATRELVLPLSWPVTPADTGTDSVLRVQSSLTQVPELDSFKPLSYSSGLLDVLLAQAVPKQQAVRPRPAAKRKATATKDFDGQGRTWSGAAAAHVPPTSGMNAVQDTHARGGHSTSPARGGHQRLDKTCITSRRLGLERRSNLASFVLKPLPTVWGTLHRI